MPSRDLNDLDPRFRPLAEQLLADAAAAGLPCTVTCTLRDHYEQAKAVAKGNSTTMKSKHLPQSPGGKALAIDIVPEALIHLPNYAPADHRWWLLGRIGLALGLRWGALWDRAWEEMPEPGRVPSWFYDPAHFELRIPKPVMPAALMEPSEVTT